MRQGGGQANPDPSAPESPSAPQRRRVRWWRVVLLTLVVPLGLGVWGWLRPTDAWLGLGLGFVPVVNLALARDQRKIPQWTRPRWVVAWAIGYGLLLGAAAPVGAWLAR